MAIKLSKTTEEGFTVEYWRVSPVITVDLEQRTARSRVVAYANAAARTGGKRPIPLDAISDSRSVQQVEISGQEFEAALATGDFRDAMYAKLKATSFFVGAEDAL